MASATRTASPAWFGRYKLVEKLGAGGMAVVYRAVNDGPQGFSRTVVIKRILPELCQNPSFTQMLIAEARLSALLHHPAIVQVYEFGEVDGEYYLAMEYVDGIDLAAVLSRSAKLSHPLPPGLCCHIVTELAAALGYAHALTDENGVALQIVHRDVSPSNVMISTQGAVKLLDFGIAKAASSIRADLTRTGMLKGKLSYMSPEQVDGQPADGRTDLFALGIILFECLTLRRLFKGEDMLHTANLVREARIPLPSQVIPGLPSDLDAVVHKLLARDPEHRFQTGEEVVAALAPFVHREQADAASLRRFLTELGPIARRPLTPWDDNAATPTSTPAPKSAGAARDLLTDGTLTRSSGEVLAPRAEPPETSPAPGRAPVLTVLTALLVAAAAAAAVFAYRTVAKRAAAPPIEVIRPVPAPQPVAVPSPPAALDAGPPAPATVRLLVDGPPGCRVIIDGQDRGPVPFEAELPRQADPRVVTVRGPAGFRWSQPIDGDRDVALKAVGPTRVPSPPPKRKTKRLPDTAILDPFEQ